MPHTRTGVKEASHTDFVIFQNITSTLQLRTVLACESAIMMKNTPKSPVTPSKVAKMACVAILATLI